MVHQAVEHHKEGLCHGHLHQRGLHCSIGAAFDDHSNMALPHELIEEVAIVNDSVPDYTPKQRRKFMLRWLKWKLTGMGMAGFRTNNRP